MHVTALIVPAMNSMNYHSYSFHCELMAFSFFNANIFTGIPRSDFEEGQAGRSRGSHHSPLLACTFAMQWQNRNIFENIILSCSKLVWLTLPLSFIVGQFWSVHHIAYCSSYMQKSVLSSTPRKCVVTISLFCIQISYILFL